MQSAALVLPLFAALALACRSAPESTGGKDPPVKTGTADNRTTPPAADTAKPDPCSAAALGLGDAVALELWNPPPGCSPRGNGKAILRSDDELTPRLECSAGMNHLVDFTRHALLVIGYTMSPASAGISAFDDGKVITLVSRQRNQCTGGPMPMPMNAAVWFQLSAGAERTFADRICTVESQCD